MEEEDFGTASGREGAKENNATTGCENKPSSSNSCSNVREEENRMASICVNMRTVYFIAKQNLLPKHYDSLLELQQRLTKDQQGTVPKAAKVEMEAVLQFLSGVIEAEIIAKVKSSPCVGLMCVDEDDDLQIGIYLKILDGNAPKMHFVKQAAVVFGEARAKENAVLNFIRESELDITKITGFGTETQCAYLGVDGQVFTVLKQHSPTVINSCKPIALVAVQLSKDVPYLDRFDMAVTCLLKFYHENRGKFDGLQEIGDVIEELELKQPNDFCWLSNIATAVDVIRRRLPEILTKVDIVANADEWSNERMMGTTLDTLMKEFKFIATLLFVADILPLVSRFLSGFPGVTMTFTQAQELLDHIVITIERFKNEPGPHLKNLKLVIADLAEHDINLSTEASEDAVNEFIKSIKLPYIESLVSQLKLQFPIFKVISSFDVFDPVNLQNIQSQNQWALERIATLTDHFHCDMTQAVSEWNQFQQHLSSCKTKADVLCCALEIGSGVMDSFPIMKKFILASSVLPFSNRQFECHTERMRKFKTELRDNVDFENDMKGIFDVFAFDIINADFLDVYRRIQIEGPELDKFDFMAAAEKWCSEKLGKEQVE